MERRFYKPLAFSLLVAIMVSCSEDKDQLTPALRREADSTFNALTSQISEEMDSICDQKFDSLVEVKFDSIVKTRRKKIERLSKSQ